MCCNVYAQYPGTQTSCTQNVQFKIIVVLHDQFIRVALWNASRIVAYDETSCYYECSVYNDSCVARLVYTRIRVALWNASRIVAYGETSRH